MIEEKVENLEISLELEKCNQEIGVSFNYNNETILLTKGANSKDIIIEVLCWLYNKNLTWSDATNLKGNFYTEEEKQKKMESSSNGRYGNSLFYRIDDNKYIFINSDDKTKHRQINKNLTINGAEINYINLYNFNNTKTSSKNKTTKHKKVIMKVEKEAQKVFNMEDFKLNMIDLIFNESGMKKFNIELKITDISNDKITDTSNDKIIIEENLEHTDLETYLKNINKEKEYYDYFLNIFNDPSVHKFITSFSSNERKIFCDLLFSINDYSDVNMTIDEIRKTRKTVKIDFIKKIETFKPSTMYGKCEFLTFLLIKTKKSADDIILGEKSFNIKYTDNIKGTIRTGKDGIHTNFDFWNKCILKIIRAIYYDNVNGDITKNFNHIDNDTVEYFKSNFKKGHYNTEFNGTDFSKIKEIISFIELKEYDVNYLESDIKKAIDFLTKDRIIQFTNDDIIIYGEYEFSHITQGRIRPVLKKRVV